MNPEAQAGSIAENGRPARLFSLLFGAFLGLSLVKFGNPAVLEKMIDWPANGWEWFYNPWPVMIGFGLLGALAVGGILVARWQANAPSWLLSLPLLWLGWQFVSATHTVDAGSTVATLKHFAAGAGCFYLGFFALAQTRNTPRFFFSGLLGGLLVVVAVGWQQHFGGLEETRRYFFTYIYPQLNPVPSEYLKKISSDRIFSTLFYPNALAGVLLLLLPVVLTLIWQDFTALTRPARRFLAGVLGAAALACLYWSKSKGGWLLMLVLGLLALLRVPAGRKRKRVLVAFALIFGLVLFAVRFSGYFTQGATSMSARMDYWQAAIRTAAANPVFGTGPGTFAVPYKQIKRPESEMARLVHNDYLEQASDSGIVGFAVYLAFIGGSLVCAKPNAATDPLRFAVWLGLLAWSLHGLMEFGLYIPALAWPAFSLMGWLLAGANQFDKPKATR
jgi:O-antigen ligase